MITHIYFSADEDKTDFTTETDYCLPDLGTQAHNQKQTRFSSVFQRES